MNFSNATEFLIPILVLVLRLSHRGRFGFARFVPRPPEHESLRQFDADDFRGLKWTPPEDGRRKLFYWTTLISPVSRISSEALPTMISYAPGSTTN